MQQRLNAIEASGKHLLLTVNDILDLAKIEAGEINFDITTVSVEEICQTSLRFVELEALSKKIKIFYPCNYTVNTLQTDARSLKQILINLLSSAVKFTPQNGKIDLKVEGNEAAEVVYFTVSDTGIGIPEHKMKHLFKPFVQVDGGLSRQYNGIGLGLALVYRLTDMLGGSVRVTSKVGHGSQFIVSLPWRVNNTKPVVIKKPSVPTKTLTNLNVQSIYFISSKLKH